MTAVGAERTIAEVVAGCPERVVLCCQFLYASRGANAELERLNAQNILQH